MPPRGDLSDDTGPGGFEAFYRATADRTLMVARRTAVGDLQLALDATQDAYVEMLRLWPDRCGRPMAANRSYVTRIAVNKVIDGYRLRNRAGMSRILNDGKSCLGSS
ncbi:RNA polymerase sigma factor [Amycolatopsis sp. NPDC058986]|uniref:RNA polymerase sigma factor n=1 Tax=unclassified Amycolatopsis TaxID=2618356 RepID=UPI003672A22E